LGLGFLRSRMSYEQWPYLTVLLALLAAGVGFPIPEDIPLLTGGYLCHIEEASVGKMIIVGLVGVLAGDLLLFCLGRRFGHRIVEHRFFRKLVNPARLLTAEQLFAKHGIKIVFFARFLPGLRPMLFMAAGVLRVKPTTFLAVNGTAACVTVPLMVFLGMFFGDSIEKISRDIRVASHTLLLLLTVAALVAAFVWVHRRQKRLIATANIPRDVKPQELIQVPNRSPQFDASDRSTTVSASTTTRPRAIVRAGNPGTVSPPSASPLSPDQP
jgi:membrane protein DedA with SNARE-associated domain